jgi:hypothetical protein
VWRGRQRILDAACRCAGAAVVVAIGRGFKSCAIALGYCHDHDDDSQHDYHDDSDCCGFVMIITSSISSTTTTTTTTITTITPTIILTLLQTALARISDLESQLKVWGSGCTALVLKHIHARLVLRLHLHPLAKTLKLVLQCMSSNFHIGLLLSPAFYTATSIQLIIKPSNRVQ